MPRYYSYCYFSLFIFSIVLKSKLLHAEELEARLLTNIPLKSNVLVIGYGYAAGNTLIDPSIIETVKEKIQQSLSRTLTNVKLEIIVRSN
jgi:hypothetical protein